MRETSSVFTLNDIRLRPSDEMAVYRDGLQMSPITSIELDRAGGIWLSGAR